MSSLQSLQKIATLNGIVARTTVATSTQAKNFSTSSPVEANKSYKLLIVGGGSGGCAIAAKFASKLGKDKIAVIEPRDTHYYQPWWTLQGGGYKPAEGAGRPMGSVLPKDATWIQDRVASFDPDNNKVMTKNGDEISYDFMLVAMGLQLFYDRVPGLLDALETPGVGSNYHPRHVGKTWKAIQDFKEGNAVFTLPNTPVKCAGAPQKIMYIAEARFREMGKRDKANFEYHTALPVLFGQKKYSDALWKVVEERNININLRSNLVEVRPDSKEAVFENLDNPEEKKVVKYGMLHVAPPMGAPIVLKDAAKLTSEDGFLTVDQHTLQHVKYPNIFGIGDCTNVPTSKTAAAVASSIPTVKKNLRAAMEGKPLPKRYDGYTSCPLIVGDGKCILAEFDFQAPPQPLETFPWDQGKPLRSSFLMKAYFMPQVYWLMTKGYWEGPRVIRKILHLGLSR